MPQIASAAKSLRQNEKRRLLNKARKTEIRTLRKKLLRAIHDEDAKGARSLYKRFSKRVDQAASKGVLHKNNAARSKSRLAKHLHSLQAA